MGTGPPQQNNVDTIHCVQWVAILNVAMLEIDERLRGMLRESGVEARDRDLANHRSDNVGQCPFIPSQTHDTTVATVHPFSGLIMCAIIWTKVASNGQQLLKTH